MTRVLGRSLGHEHNPRLQYLKIDQAFDPLRPEPRFQDLVRRVGLPQ